MILKVEMLLETTSDMVDVHVIAALLNSVFVDNSHLANIIICEVTDTPEEGEK